MDWDPSDDDDGASRPPRHRPSIQTHHPIAIGCSARSTLAHSTRRPACFWDLVRTSGMLTGSCTISRLTDEMHYADMESDDDRRSAVPSWHDEDEDNEGEDEGEEGASRTPSAAELLRRQRLGAMKTEMHARLRGERADPFADVRVGYVVDLLTSPRFAGLASSASHAILLHTIHFFQRHLLQHQGAVAAEPAPYVSRRRDKGRGGFGGSRFDPAPTPLIDEHALQKAAAVPDASGTMSRDHTLTRYIRDSYKLY
jgi:hypothetical protein